MAANRAYNKNYRIKKNLNISNMNTSSEYIYSAAMEQRDGLKSDTYFTWIKRHKCLWVGGSGILLDSDTQISLSLTNHTCTELKLSEQPTHMQQWGLFKGGSWFLLVESFLHLSNFKVARPLKPIASSLAWYAW